MDIYQIVMDKIHSFRRFNNSNPKYLIIDIETFYDIKSNRDYIGKFVPSCYQKDIGPDKFIGLNIAVLSEGNETIIEVR